MRRSIAACVAWGLASVWASAVADDALPFQQKVEVFRDEEGDVRAFRLRLEQPFLAEEFEKSNYLRLQSPDERAYLIYPKETKFHQKHAEFFGRLRGEGTVTLKLAYEIVSENPDGSRHIEVRRGDVEVTIPAEPVGPKSIFTAWAREQNLYFAQLLRYYPDETFFQYCLLQSKARYGVEPPPISKPPRDRTELETDMYRMFTGSLALQEALQRETLSGGGDVGDLNTHISSVTPPNLRSLPYEDLLEEKREQSIEPKVHPITALVPEDQYFLHFNTIQSLDELLDLCDHWGDNVLRMFTVRAQDNRVRAKLEDQLCVRWDPLKQLFADKVVGELAVTGADTFLLQGTDLTVILRLEQAEVFNRTTAGWLDEVRKEHKGVVDREFNYRGHKVVAHYTNDRVVSSFVVQHGDYVVYSNSHRAIRRVIDVVEGLSPSLHDALDYRYVTTIMPPLDAANSGYFFGSEAFIKRLTGPAFKISQKRRLQCFNNLVMLNNASLFFRLENGRSPESLSELIKGNFVDREKIVCSHGGGYAFDAENDMCTCSLHNRLKYLTPNVELSVLNVSSEEAAQYDRYKKRYKEFWQTMFDPIAVRITVGPRLVLEACVLPMANGSMVDDLRSMVEKSPRPIPTDRFASSAVASFVTVSGRERIADMLRSVPGVTEVLHANPTLTDMSWIGDQVGVHLCDGETILQIDPVRLRPLEVPLVGKAELPLQGLAAALVMAMSMPVYVTIDIENRASASRMLEQLSQQIFLRSDSMFDMETTLDAYRLPDYKEHAIYVFSFQVYALKVRLHVALAGDQLVAATKPDVLKEVIDASTSTEPNRPVEAHALLRFSRVALNHLVDDLELYWSEKSRVACHRNLISIYNLCKLYNTPIDRVSHLAEAKYGVRYFCPDHGDYSFDTDRNQVLCSVHGNREQSRQNPRPDRDSSFSQFIESFEEIIATIRFEDDAMIATVQIVRGSRSSRRQGTR